MGPECIKRVLSCLERPGVYLAGATHDTIIPEELLRKAIGYICRTEQIRSGVTGWYPFPVAAMMAFRRELLEETGWYDEKMVACDDARMLLRVVRKYGRNAAMVHPDAWVYSTPPPDAWAWLRMKARHRAAHQAMLKAEPSLIRCARWRQRQERRRALKRRQRPRVLARMAAEGIPLDTLDFLTGSRPVVLWVADHQPPITDDASRWTPDVRVPVQLPW